MLVINQFQQNITASFAIFAALAREIKIVTNDRTLSLFKRGMTFHPAPDVNFLKKRKPIN